MEIIISQHIAEDEFGKKDVCHRCPVCEGDTSNLALTKLVVSFEICRCDKATYEHLVETTWHRDCYDKQLNPK